jgi:phage terminase large subunit-like protein
MRDCSFCGQSTSWAELLSDDRVLCPACRPCIFFEKHLSLTGDYAGRPFTLMPWIRQVLRDIFGTIDENGLRQYRDIYLEVAKKNSKTTLCAGLVVYCLSTATAGGTEVYSAATSKDQAGIVFRLAQQMVRCSPELSRRLSVIPSTKRIVRRDDPTSFFAAISADGDVHDGINPCFVVRDELHRWRTRKALELNEILERGMITREEPLVIDITTAGEIGESPLCWRRHEYARQMQAGTFEDRRFYGRIWAADTTRIESESDFWTTREARVQANPSHEDRGGYLKDSVLADLCLKAQNDPKVRVEYLRYHLNYWGQADDSVIEMPKWIACGGDIDLRTWPEYDVDLLIQKWKLRKRSCFAGIDASWTTDLTALSLVFPPDADDDPWILLTFFWMAADRVAERERRDKVPYSLWCDQKFIETTPGESIDLAVIKDKVHWANKTFYLQELCFDPWGFRQTSTDLAADGFTCVAVNQNYSLLSEPTKKLLAWYLDGKIWHGNHPVLNWNASCLALQADHKDNVQPRKPERAKSSKRIDGISATVTALARAIVSVENTITYTEVRSVG